MAAPLNPAPLQPVLLIAAQSCGTCAFAREIEGVPTSFALDCCKEVPRILDPAEPIEEPDTRLRWAYWPVVKPSGWCGEFKANPPQVNLLQLLADWWRGRAAKPL